MPIHVATPGLHCVSLRKAVINSAASVILAVGLRSPPPLPQPLLP